MDEKVAEDTLGHVQSKHPTATHHCYAWLMDPHKERGFSSDDGEPGGTAGLPILNMLRSYDLINVILIVARYYGGTKLGKAGLIDAYGHSAERTIQAAELKKVIPVRTFRIVYDYPYQGHIDKLKNDFTWIERDASYLEKVVLTCGIPSPEAGRFGSKLNSLKHLFHEIEATGEGFHIVE
jgi:uncharacterized YigZ family protein